jgi:thioredoxin-related protein
MEENKLNEKEEKVNSSEDNTAPLQDKIEPKKEITDKKEDNKAEDKKEEIEPHKEQHHKKHHKKHKLTLNEGHIIYVGIALILVLLINSVIVFNISSELNDPSVPKEILAKIQLTIITDPTCEMCTDISAATQQIKSSKATITKETTLDYTSDKVQEFINKYEIKKLPTIIVTGELDKYSNKYLVKKEGFMIYEDVSPPYLDTETKKLVGGVTLTLINDKDCPQCVDLTGFADQFRDLGIAVTVEKIFDVTDSEAYKLVQEYDIERLPSLIFSKDAGVYENFVQGFPQVGSTERDGSYVVRVIPPPYITFPEGEVIGIVDITYLADKSCAECYDVNIHKQILTNPQGFAISVGKEEIIDVSSKEGKALLTKYNVTRIPTIVLSKDAKEYKILDQTWPRVGTVEKDGTYIFRELGVMQGSYKHYPTGEILGNAEG